ncbi:MAG: hypothetical protein LAO55_21445 [Acidobacteriia bacterium]|nr:hypothetical protein [Terriglobia bacterium]
MATVLSSPALATCIYQPFEYFCPIKQYAFNQITGKRVFVQRLLAAEPYTGEALHILLFMVLKGLQTQIEGFIVSVYPRADEWATTVYDCQLCSLNSNDMDVPEHIENNGQDAQKWGVEKATALAAERGLTPESPTQWDSYDFGEDSQYVWHSE